MPAKIRLARHGKKRAPFYYIVVADARAPRDGKFIERIGSYNPNTNPATIELDFDSALEWLQKGVQPTDTMRAILSYKGVLMKHHLLKGVKKGAFSEEVAEQRFQEWMTEKESKIQNKVSKIGEAQRAEDKTRFDREAKINDDRTQKILKRDSEIAAKLKEEEKAAEAEAAAKLAEAKEAKAAKEVKTDEVPVEAKTDEAQA